MSGGYVYGTDGLSYLLSPGTPNTASGNGVSLARSALTPTAEYGGDYATTYGTTISIPNDLTLPR